MIFTLVCRYIFNDIFKNLPKVFTGNIYGINTTFCGTKTYSLEILLIQLEFFGLQTGGL